MVSSWVCWASMPVFEIHRERIMTGLRSLTPMVADGARRQPWKRGPYRHHLRSQPRLPAARASAHREQLRRGLLVAFGGLQDLHLRFELARRRDHRDHRLDCTDVRAFERAVLDPG